MIIPFNYYGAAQMTAAGLSIGCIPGTLMLLFVPSAYRQAVDI